MMTHRPTPPTATGRRGLLTALLLTTAALAQAADMPATKPADDKLASARTLVAQQRWPAAIDELKRLNDTGNADWQNLMGYSLRKASPPDYPAAERHYTEALRINPSHRGALEYSGELYLLMGDLPRAEQQLARLDKACTFGCEEYTDLKRAIAQHKAGNAK
jgi:tetratricopeptide (TPR) repeat protein